ncbi:MAG: hypothetical protein GY832_11980, partial [Chloroflexi bacterium]|nr:hypothetical protein [Chloroflexota bacterium]
KDSQRDHAKTAGPVQEVQVESAASVKGRRQKDKKDGADNVVNEPQLQIDNVSYHQAFQGRQSGPQQQRYNPLPPPPLPPPSYYYQDMPR